MDALSLNKELGILESVCVFEYHDGPRLLIAKNESERLFLGVFADFENEVETWVFAPISPQKAWELQMGWADFHGAFKSALNGKSYVIKVNQKNIIVSEGWFDCTSLPEDWLPDPGEKSDKPESEIIEVKLSANDQLLPRQFRQKMRVA